MINTIGFDLNYFVPGRAYSVIGMTEKDLPFMQTLQPVTAILMDSIAVTTLRFEIYYTEYETGRIVHLTKDITSPEYVNSKYEFVLMNPDYSEFSNDEDDEPVDVIDEEDYSPLHDRGDTKSHFYISYTDRYTDGHTIGRFIDFEKNDSYLINPETSFDNISAYRLMRRCLIDKNGLQRYAIDGDFDNMTRLCKFWYRVEPVNVDGDMILSAKYYISDKPKEGFKLHPLFNEDDNNDVFVSSYICGYDTDKNEIVSSYSEKRMYFTKVSDFTEKLTPKGDKWDMWSIEALSAIQLLAIVEHGLDIDQYIDYNMGTYNTIHDFGSNKDQLVYGLALTQQGEVEIQGKLTGIKYLHPLDGWVEYFTLMPDEYDWVFLPMGSTTMKSFSAIKGRCNIQPKKESRIFVTTRNLFDIDMSLNVVSESNSVPFTTRMMFKR